MMPYQLLLMTLGWGIWERGRVGLDHRHGILVIVGLGHHHGILFIAGLGHRHVLKRQERLPPPLPHRPLRAEVGKV